MFLFKQDGATWILLPPKPPSWGRTINHSTDTHVQTIFLLFWSLRLCILAFPIRDLRKTSQQLPPSPRPVAAGSCLGLLEPRASVGFPCIYFIVSNVPLISFNFRTWLVRNAWIHLGIFFLAAKRRVAKLCLVTEPWATVCPSVSAFPRWLLLTDTDVDVAWKASLPCAPGMCCPSATDVFPQLK